MAGRATCASRSQLASLNACQIPLRSGLPAIRGGLYPVVCAEHTESVAIARMAATVTGFDMDISNELSSAGATRIGLEVSYHQFRCRPYCFVLAFSNSRAPPMISVIA